MTADVLIGAGRCFPRVVVRADFAVASGHQSAQHVRGTGVSGDRIGDDVCRPDAVLRKERVKPRQGVNIAELLMCTRGRVPLVVAFSIDADQEIHRSYGLDFIDPDPSLRA